MSAPCLLGCRGTARQRPVPDGTGPRGLPYDPAASSIVRHQEVFSNTLSSGLLIRGFGVRVPGGAPVLTWGFIAPGHFCVRFVPVGAENCVTSCDLGLFMGGRQADAAVIRIWVMAAGSCGRPAVGFSCSTRRSRFPGALAVPVPLVPCSDISGRYRTLNPRVRGSGPWRRTRSDLGLFPFPASTLILCGAGLRPSWGHHVSSPFECAGEMSGLGRGAGHIPAGLLVAAQAVRGCSVSFLSSSAG